VTAPLADRPVNAVPTPRWWLVAGVAWITVQVLLQENGLLAHDTRFDVLLEPRDFLTRVWHLWDGRADLGRVQNQAVGYLFPLGPFHWLTELAGVPRWISERLWMALLLGLAFWGMVRVVEQLVTCPPAVRLLAGASYALSPFFVARVGITSFFVQGAALLPWVVLPLIIGARRGSVRQAACRSGVAVVAIGGVNAVGTGAVLAVPALWLLTRQRSERRRALIRWWLAAVVCATAWWGLPLLFQGAYGMDFLPLTERAGLTTGPTVPFEVLRGTADWLSRLVLDVPQSPAGALLVSSRPLIAMTGLLAALGVFGLARRDAPERAFLVMTLLLGLALVGAAHGGLFGNPAAEGVRSFLDGPGAVFRNVYKFQPIVLFALAIGVAHGTAALVPLAQRAWPAKQHLAAAASVVAVGALVLGSAQPVFANELLHARPFRAVPSWWSDAAAHLGDVDGRTLVVPGMPHADFRWGYTEEEPLFWLTDQPWASRMLIPLGTYGAIQYLDVIEDAVARGGDPALVEFLQRGGFSTVLARNDGRAGLVGAPNPTQLHDALVASGLDVEASFGPELEDVVGIDGATLHAIDVYAVPPPPGDPRVAVYAVADAVTVSGDAGAALALAPWDLAQRAIVLAADVDGGDTGPPDAIVTDGNRRRGISFGATRNNRGYSLSADEPLPPLMDEFPGTQVQDQALVVRNGVTEVGASSFGSVFAPQAEWAPSRAVDGDPATAWAPAIEVTPQHQFIRVDFDARRTASFVEVDLLTPAGQPDAVQVLRVATEAGDRVVRVDPTSSTQRVELLRGETSWVVVEFEIIQSTPLRVGIAELRVDGVDIDQRLAPPRRPVTTDPMPTYVFTRTPRHPVTGLEADAERTMRRRFTVPRSGDVMVDAMVQPVPGDALLELLDESDSFTVQATSTFRSLPAYAPRHLVDGDDDTTWVSGLLDDGITLDNEPLVTMSWAELRRLNQVVVEAAPGYPQPRSIRVTANGTVFDVHLDDDGVGSFAPVVTDAVTISFVLPPPGVFPLTTPEVSRMRLGLSALEFAGVGDLQPGPIDADAVIEIACANGPEVAVGDDVRRFSVSATLDDIRQLRTVRASACDASPIDLGQGDHELDVTPSPLFDVTGVRLSDGDDAVAAAAPPRQATVASWTDERRTISVGAGPAAYLAVNENANPGWQATLDGDRLESVVLDGWRQGYLVPAGSEGVVTIRFAPTGPYRLSLLFGGVLVAVLLVGAIRRPRAEAAAPAAIAWAPGRGASMVGLALLVVFGGVPAATTAAACALLTRRQHRPVDLSVLVALLLLAATIGAALPLPLDQTSLWKPFGDVVSALTVLAIAVLAATVPESERAR
jgi:arabinofuranan 3-O-arabinosyltransferase